MSAFDLIGDVVGTAVNAGVQTYVNNANWKRQTLLNELNYRRYLEQRGYDNPISQLQRLRAAGINPALYFSGNGMSSSSPAPMASGYNDVAPDMSGILSDVFGLRMQQAQIDNLNAQTAKTEAETKTEDMLREERYKSLVEANANMSKQTQEVAERIKSYADQHRLNEAQLEQLKFERVMEGKRYMLDYKRLKNDTKLSDKQIEKMNADIQKTLAEKKVTEREYQEMVWTYAIRKTGLANDVNLTKAQIDQAKATAKKLGIEGDLDAPMAFTRRQMLSELEGGLIGASAAYAVYDVIDNFGRFIH